MSYIEYNENIYADYCNYSEDYYLTDEYTPDDFDSGYYEARSGEDEACWWVDDDIDY